MSKLHAFKNAELSATEQTNVEGGKIARLLNIASSFGFGGFGGGHSFGGFGGFGGGQSSSSSSSQSVRIVRVGGRRASFNGGRRSGGFSRRRHH